MDDDCIFSFGKHNYVLVDFRCYILHGSYVDGVDSTTQIASVRQRVGCLH